MRHIILFDTDLRRELLPFTLTKPVSELRIGILNNREKWDLIFSDASFSHITSDELEPLYPINIQKENTLINGSLVPGQPLKRLIENLHSNEALMLDGELIAALLPEEQFTRLLQHSDLNDLHGYELGPGDAQMVKHLWELCDLASDQISADMQLLGVLDQAIERRDIKVIGDYPVFIDRSAIIERVTLNASEGPIYIGAESLLMDGVHLRGPVAIGANSVIKMGANIYGGTVVGPKCVIGGEVKKSLILGYSNKAHEGYLGDSVIGEWCNLGALTSNSNLKNTFSEVDVWHHPSQSFLSSGKIKCGIFMGDYSRTAIHTKLNAGSVIGVSCHLFGTDVISGFVPSFSWGPRSEYRVEDALTAAMRIQSLKGKILESQESDLLRQIFFATKGERPKQN